MKTTLTTLIGASAPSFGLPQRRIDGQRVLQALELGAEDLELLRLGLVADGDERFERRLEVEPFVLVDLVRADGRLDRRVELHPGDVARVVVVRDERVGAGCEEMLERRLRRELRRFTQQRSRKRQLALIFIEYGTAAKRPSGPRRIVVKKPVAAGFAAPGSASIHFCISSFEAPAG